MLPEVIPPLLANISREQWPRHVAIIMDGNGRWAQRRNLPRVEGHRRGVETVRKITEECSRLGVEQLTLYCLSSENWKRPSEEIDFLMHLLRQYVIEERKTIMENDIRVRMIGRRMGIPEPVLHELGRTVEMSSHCDGLWLNLAINYGGRAELVDAVRAIGRKIAAAEMTPEEVDEKAIADHLYTAGTDDPDLLIRTAGELRISNFLLWQISYSEILITDKCWPEFDEEMLHTAIADFASRDRKFGGLAV